MADDPNAPPLSDTASSSTGEPPNRLEPVIETPVSASESAGTQEQSANTATESASVASEQPEAPSPSKQPKAEAQSAQPVSEPPTVPPAPESGTPEANQEKQENQES